MTDSQYASVVSYRDAGIFKNKKPLLGRIDIELTERCNNRCIHCLINQPEDDREVMSREMDTGFVKEVL